MAVLSYDNILPEIHNSVFIAEGVQIIGRVTMKKFVNCWYNAVVRGDVNSIFIDEGTNIQDSCVLHVSYNTQALIIGKNVTVGHSAVLHSCTIEDATLIGMGAIVLDGAKICSHSMIGAGSVVSPRTEIPSGVLALGIPAKVVRTLTEKEILSLEESATHYREEAEKHKLSTRKNL